MLGEGEEGDIRRRGEGYIKSSVYYEKREGCVGKGCIRREDAG